MVTRIDLDRPEHEQVENLSAGVRELNEEMASVGISPGVVVGKDGFLHIAALGGALVRVTEDSLAARVRSHCEPGRYRIKETTDEDGTVSKGPVWCTQPSLPRAVVRAYISSRMWPGVPVVRQVATAPVVRPDLTVCWNAGWDEATACWVLPGVEPDTSLMGTDPRSFFDQFALTDRRQVADCLAAALTPLLSTAITGALPGFIAVARNPGSGKTYLSCLVSRMAGHEIEVTRWPGGGDELSKAVSSYVAQDRPVVIFDNIKNKVDSPDLESVITARKSSFRVMRTHTTVNMASNTVWMMTVNNAEVSQDLQRRCIVVDLDPTGAPSPAPWDGSVDTWSKENRAALVTLMCSLIEAWRDAGAVPGSVVHPGFEQWSQTVSGILECAGVGGMWEAREDVLSDAVTNESDDYQEILERIYTLTAGDQLSAREIWDRANGQYGIDGDSVLRDFLVKPGSAGINLGKLQGSKGAYSITRKRSNGFKWKVCWEHAVTPS